jgi:hypothetical protein
MSFLKRVARKALKYLIGREYIDVGSIYKDNKTGVYVIIENVDSVEVKYTLYYKGFGRSTRVYFSSTSEFLSKFKRVS